MRINFFLICFTVVSMLTSCFQPDKPVVPKNTHQDHTLTIDMGCNQSGDYKNQVYLDLESNIIKTTDKNTWDLGFECSASGFHIILNSARYEFIKNTHHSNFDSVYTAKFDYNDHSWKFDAAGGSVDSTAIGDWRMENYVYILCINPKNPNSSSSYMKLKFISSDSSGYHFIYSDLQNNSKQDIRIEKTAELNYVHFSLSSSQIVDGEPSYENWTLLFTQYTDYATRFGFTLPYPVAGVLQNSRGVKVAMDSIHPYADIHIDSVKNYTFSERLNTIGYNKWKEIQGNEEQGGVFIVYPKYNYIIQDAKGNYFKLHFIDFYNDKYEYGYPRFEYAKL